MNLVSEGDPTIDAEIDGFTKELAATDRAFVVDSRLAWHFVEDALKVFLLVDTAQAVSRVLSDQPSRSETESYRGTSDAVRDILARQESERRRFQSTYGVDLFRWSNYDLMIDTSEISAEEAVELILSHRREAPPAPTRLWLAPRSLYPTEHVRELAGERTEEILESMREQGFSREFPIDVVASRDRGLYVIDGHRRLSCALRLGLKIVPGRLVGQDEDEISPNMSVRTLLAAQPRRSWLNDWEDAHGFRFTSYPGEPAQPCDPTQQVGTAGE